jgi:hypothetical protein
MIKHRAMSNFVVNILQTGDETDSYDLNQGKWSNPMMV